MIYKSLTLDFGTRQCPVHIGQNLFTDDSLLIPHIHGHQVMIVTQDKIAKSHLEKFLRPLRHYQCDVFYLPDGEAFKTVEQWQKILDELLLQHHERTTTLLAVGGGMVGDITGFAAACYLRGVRYIQVPSTLIAQVDAALGGKTGVNHPSGKNLIGAVHQPQCVIVDIDFLTTLPRREYIAGLAEIVKYGLILDVEFFTWLEKNAAALLAKNPDVLLEAITISVSIKARIVVADEHDHGQRHLLNFGHTFGHALETAGEYKKLLHGEAVAIGMAIAAELSADLNWITRDTAARVKRLLRALELPVSADAPAVAEFIRLMRHDKKVEDGKINLILLQALGRAVKTSAVSETQLAMTLKNYFSHGWLKRRFTEGYYN